MRKTPVWSTTLAANCGFICIAIAVRRSLVSKELQRRFCQSVNIWLNFFVFFHSERIHQAQAAAAKARKALQQKPKPASKPVRSLFRMKCLVWQILVWIVIQASRLNFVLEVWKQRWRWKNARKCGGGTGCELQPHVSDLYNSHPEHTWYTQVPATLHSHHPHEDRSPGCSQNQPGVSAMQPLKPLFSSLPSKLNTFLFL